MNFPPTTVVHEWRPACWLKVTGEDAGSFLQGQFTNELRGLPVGGAVYGLWLTLKGKVLADSFIVCGAATTGAPVFWVGSYASPVSVIRDRLENYVIADDVVIEDFTEERVGFSFLGYGEQSGWAGSDEVVFRGRRAVEENLEWVFPISRRSEARKRVAGLTEVGFDEMSRRRIEARIPAVPADIGPGDLPGEGGLEAAAVSYTKGCYLGQEVMARLKSMGQVRRRLMKVTGSGDPPAGGLPAEIFAGDRKAGELRSVARREAGGWVGLAMITLMHVGPGASLALTAKGGQTVELMDAP